MSSSFLKQKGEKKKDSTQLETQPLQGQHSNKIKVLKIKYHPLIPSLVNKKNESNNSFLTFFSSFEVLGLFLRSGEF